MSRQPMATPPEPPPPEPSVAERWELVDVSSALSSELTRSSVAKRRRLVENNALLDIDAVNSPGAVASLQDFVAMGTNATEHEGDTPPATLSCRLQTLHKPEQPRNDLVDDRVVIRLAYFMGLLLALLIVVLGVALLVGSATLAWTVHDEATDREARSRTTFESLTHNLTDSTVQLVVASAFSLLSVAADETLSTVRSEIFSFSIAGAGVLLENQRALSRRLVGISTYVANDPVLRAMIADPNADADTGFEILRRVFAAALPFVSSGEALTVYTRTGTGFVMGIVDRNDVFGPLSLAFGADAGSVVAVYARNRSAPLPTTTEEADRLYGGMDSRPESFGQLPLSRGFMHLNVTGGMTMECVNASRYPPVPLEFHRNMFGCHAFAPTEEIPFAGLDQTIDQPNWDPTAPWAADGLILTFGAPLASLGVMMSGVGASVFLPAYQNASFTMPPSVRKRVSEPGLGSGALVNTTPWAQDGWVAVQNAFEYGVENFVEMALPTVAQNEGTHQGPGLRHFLDVSYPPDFSASFQLSGNAIAARLAKVVTSSAYRVGMQTLCVHESGRIFASYPDVLGPTDMILGNVSKLPVFDELFALLIAGRATSDGIVPRDQRNRTWSWYTSARGAEAGHFISPWSLRNDPMNMSSTMAATEFTASMIRDFAVAEPEFVANKSIFDYITGMVTYNVAPLRATAAVVGLTADEADRESPPWALVTIYYPALRMETLMSAYITSINQSIFKTQAMSADADARINATLAEAESDRIKSADYITELIVTESILGSIFIILASAGFAGLLVRRMRPFVTLSRALHKLARLEFDTDPFGLVRAGREAYATERLGPKSTAHRRGLGTKATVAPAEGAVGVDVAEHHPDGGDDDDDDGLTEADRLNASRQAVLQRMSRFFEVSRLQLGYYALHTALRSFEKFVPRAIVRNMMRRGVEARTALGPKQATVFFMDIAGFTSFVETNDNVTVMLLVDDFLSVMSECIVGACGVIDKYIGDCIMALWNVPEPQVNPRPEQCCMEAIARCTTVLPYMQASWRAQSIPELHFRIGAHSGPVLAGLVGSHHRLGYTAIGDTVNTASRLEGVNKVTQTRVLVSGDFVRALPPGTLQVVGASQTVQPAAVLPVICRAMSAASSESETAARTTTTTATHSEAATSSPLLSKFRRLWPTGRGPHQSSHSSMSTQRVPPRAASPPLPTDTLMSASSPIAPSPCTSQADSPHRPHDSHSPAHHPVMVLGADGFVVREIGPVSVEGRMEAITVHEVIGPAWAVPADTRRGLALYRRALDAFMDYELDAAEAAITEALHVIPSDGPSSVLLRRIQTLKAAGPTEDGTYDLALVTKK
eukprot:TRINITY_DN8441_c0_g2_i1.p1 TRINITY_DN8441_c0_g2~~TRINITY_DN8441_c0_g2_i1.p1  ORF type:complete len:1339 (+),score=255.15 TRINITY_DN8441_c0_g2_i1:92-4108(+)